MSLRVCLLFWLAAAAFAADAAKPIPPVKFTDTRLENGLRVIICEDHYAPIYAIAVSYGAGSKDERPGRTGFAHLFEHMMFKGSANVGPGEHFFLIFTNGGNMNGTTNTDRTLYFEVLPKNQLDLGLFLESDRMRSLAVDKENLENQRQTVKEERRLGVDNQPYGRTADLLPELAYDAFPYKHSVIGSMTDLDAATVEDVKEFFRVYYAPNNAVLALVGDLDTAPTLAKVRKYFGNIARQEAPKALDFSETPRSAERREQIEDKLARLARIDIAYKLPRGGTPDFDALSALSTILAAGESSRLYQKLVKEKEVAVGVSGFPEERTGPGLFRFVASIPAGKQPEDALKLLDEEVARMRAEPVTEKELLRARTSARRSQISLRTSVLSRAISLADNAVLFNDPGRLNTVEQRSAAVTADQIREAAGKYLRPENRIVIVTVPAVPVGAPKPLGAKPGAE
jgi:predicted Zn-dependent peptidase